MPNTLKISQMSLLNVLTGSTSRSLSTFIIDVPSVSSNHSPIALNSPDSVITILFLLSVCGKCIYTFPIASMPCKVMSESILASMHLKNISSSILSTEFSSSLSWNLLSSLFMILMRSTNLSALSSLNMQFKSSPKLALIFSAICSIVNFLSVIRLRSNSILKSHGEIFVGSKSGIS